MKKIFKFCAVGLLALCCQSLSNTVLVETQNHNDLIASTEDVFNEKQNIAKYNIKRAASSSNLDCSKIYTQYGHDGSNYYLRFATAVKGDLDSITYSADILDSDVEIEDKNVQSVYKSIAADGESFYHNGRDLINKKLTSTNDYYWACLTIKFDKDSEYMSSDIKVDINVNNGAYTNTRTTSLDALLNGETQPDDSSTLPTFNYGEAVEYTKLSEGGYKMTADSKKFYRYTTDELKENEYLKDILPTYNGTDGTTISGYSGSYCVPKGTTSDGYHIYQAFYHSESEKGYDIGIIAKLEPNGTIIGTTEYSYHWGENVRLGFSDGKIYVGRTSKKQTHNGVKSYSGKTLVFDTNLKLVDDDFKPETPTPMHNNVAGQIDLVAGSKDGTKVAYVYQWLTSPTTRKLYAYQKNSDGTYECLIDGAAVPTGAGLQGKSGAATGMYGNDSYLYILYNVASGPIVQVLDWNGNTLSAGELNSNELSISGNIGAYVGLFEMNDKLYYSIQYYLYKATKGYSLCEITHTISPK